MPDRILISVPLEDYTELVKRCERLDLLCEEWSNKNCELSYKLEAVIKTVLEDTPNYKHKINEILINPVPFLKQ